MTDYQLIDTDDRLGEALTGLDADQGPLAIDTERACGFRYYDERAYLIQVKAATTPAYLVDPVGLTPAGLARLGEVLSRRTWILHAASQDMPCLRDSGLDTDSLLDTELAARLLGRDRVGLGSLVLDVLGVDLTKTHANSDWSIRPLPVSWLAYAADDVEYLIPLWNALHAELAAAGKREWAAQEFAYALGLPPRESRADPWRSTTDIHLVRSRRGLAVIRELWAVRDGLARAADLAPHLVVRDWAIAAAARALADTPGLPVEKALGGAGWRTPTARAHLAEFQVAAAQAMHTPESDLPPVKLPRVGPPPPGTWRRRDPGAADRWARVHPAILDLAQALAIPVENLAPPRALRALLWEPAGEDAAAVDRQLAALDVRPWQRDLIVPVIVERLRAATPPVPAP